MESSLMNQVEDYEVHSRHILSERLFDYYRREAGDEGTMCYNKNAFRRIILCPKVLRDVSKIDTTTTVLGNKIKSPFCVAPTAIQKMAHPDGEIATAKAAFSKGVCMTLNSVSTTTIEEIGQAIPEGLKWFQLYMHPDRKITKNLIRRAEKAGFSAVVLIVVPFPGLRPYYTKGDKGSSLPPHVKLVNYPEKTLPDGPLHFKDFTQLCKNKLTWTDVDWLRSFTKLPVVLKGIQTKEDAELALKHGVSAIWVSNQYGGRQLDSAEGIMDVFPEVFKAVNGRVEVYVDGGIQTGQDVFKALALGAQAVFIGPPLVWGLTCEGQDGVQKVLEVFQKELETAMGLLGCSKISDINPSYIREKVLM